MKTNNSAVASRKSCLYLPAITWAGPHRVPRTGHQLFRLRHGDHLCLFHNDHAERMTVIVPFFKDGFARGERCIYVVDEEGREEVVQCFKGS